MGDTRLAMVTEARTESERSPHWLRYDKVDAVMEADHWKKNAPIGAIAGVRIRGVHLDLARGAHVDELGSGQWSCKGLSSFVVYYFGALELIS